MRTGLFFLGLLLLAVRVHADTAFRCGQQPNLGCANGAQTANQDISTLYNFKGSNTLFTADGVTADANKITVALTGDPAGSFTVKIPAGADSATAQTKTAISGQALTAFDATTGAFTQAAIAASSLRWDQLVDPTGNLALAMAARTTTFTWGNTTGAGTDMFSLKDTASNSGTGYVFSVNTASSSAAKPIRFTAGGTANGVAMTTTGLLAPIGTGGIEATTVDPGGLTNVLVWNELCTTSPCTLASTPRTADTLVAFWRTGKLRRVASCGGVNEYTLSGATFTLCDATGVGANADSVQLVYEL